MFGDPSRRPHERIAAGEDDFPNLFMVSDVGKRGLEVGRRKGPSAVADVLAAKTIAAIGRAGVHRHQQHAVAIAVDDPFHGAERRVADRVAVLTGIPVQFVSRRDELPGDRIVRIAAVDKGIDRRGDGDGVARRRHLDGC